MERGTSGSDGQRETVDLARLRQLPPGPDLWRSLEELAGTAQFAAFLRAEFPALAEVPTTDRRRFLKLVGASLALAGIAGCSRIPTDEVVPYVRAPEDIVPGQPQFYATAVGFDGFAQGVLVESNMGRPTKVEGNPQHPASLGGTTAQTQAAVLELWNPERSQAISHRGDPRTWNDFLQALAVRRAHLQQNGGAGLCILTETGTSPTLHAQIEGLLADYPQAAWFDYRPSGPDHAPAGAAIAFGAPLQPRYRLDLADVVVCLDADPLGSGPAQARYAYDFSLRRHPQGARPMSRVYVAEPTPTLTGAAADRRLSVSASSIDTLARELARAVNLIVPVSGQHLGAAAQWVQQAAADLLTARGRGLVMAGPQQPPGVHALADAINANLGNVGEAVTFSDPIARTDRRGGSLADLATRLDRGDVDTLIIVDANPAYAAPGGLDLATRIKRAKLVVHFGLYRDETAQLADWHIPAAHAFEDWSDLRAFDGTMSIVQPVIAPLYASRSAHELIDALHHGFARASVELVKSYWRRQLGSTSFDQQWRSMLQAGVIDGTRLPDVPVHLATGWASNLPPASMPTAAALELVVRPDPTIHDGRFAHNGWLQELPKPLTKLTWDNAALVSPALAQRVGLHDGDVVELTVDRRALRAPIWIMPGQAETSVTVSLGYGRRVDDMIAEGAGYDAYAIQGTAQTAFVGGLQLAATGARRSLASTQHHHSMEGRRIVRYATLDEFQRDPGFARDPEQGHRPSLYPGWPRGDYAWGMAIDLNACIGCSACVVACQAENNIPVVGKAQVRVGRELHWLRIDRYYAGSVDEPQTLFQPVPCMHCEQAPCELVCPVGATVHDSQGLNLQVYNRCVGTRFCSNNCPYKVRRFNFLDYENHTPQLEAQRNPEVTVRRGGVMEKCTYCLQRIETARIAAQNAGRRVADGEVVTACQAACPTKAIVFGDLTDPHSAVSQAKQTPRNYELLGELNTRPRTTYLARVTNPGSAGAGSSAPQDGAQED